MKELSIEEKAKRYDEVIRKAESLYKAAEPMSGCNVILETIFPELAESEDERIKNFISNELMCLRAVEYNSGGKDSDRYKELTSAISWLEKQGEKNNNEDADILQRFSFYSYKDEPNVLYLSNVFVNEEYRNRSLCTNILKIADEVSTYMRCDSIRLKTKIGSNAEELYRKNGYNTLKKEGDYIWLEKQGEQKSTEKVEPKFHEGQWITNGDYTWRIVVVNPLDYILQSQDGNIVYDTISHVDEQFHSFTIEDAKDGDVLTCESGWTCIFKALDNHNNTFSSYCFMDKDEWFCDTGSECHTLNEQFIKAYNFELHPATKKQCNLLFQKMHEAGYIWDADKKELKKIEQNPVWSEEDEKLYNDLSDTYFYNDEDYPEETYKYMLKKVLNWMDKRAKYLRPQKQEWSEEDKHEIQHIIDFLNHPDLIKATPTIADKCKNWLKSLRPKNTWKPSDEQMTQLQKYCPDNRPLTSLYEQLKKLREE